MAKSKQDPILHAAADWWVRLRVPDAEGETIEQWLAWTGEDPRHLEAFERVNQLANRLGSLDSVTRQGLIKAFGRTVTPERRWMPLAAAASFVAVMLGGAYITWIWFNHVNIEVYHSAIAQNRDITLPDGTQVALGAASTMTTHFSRGRRQIDLTSGEAFFTVVHDNSRPFVVGAGDISVRDIGTAFDVRRTGDRVTIAVTQGRVQVSNISEKPGANQRGTLEVTAGQLVSYDPNTSAMSMGSMTAEQATGWQDHRLEFVDEPLSVVIANLNRYSPQPVHIADTDLDKLTYTGLIRTDAIDSWLDALPKLYPLRVDTHGNQVILSDEHPATHR
jgi:transmembrane sensor